MHVHTYDGGRVSMQVKSYISCEPGNWVQPQHWKAKKTHHIRDDKQPSDDTNISDSEFVLHKLGEGSSDSTLVAKFCHDAADYIGMVDPQLDKSFLISYSCATMRGCIKGADKCVNSRTIPRIVRSHHLKATFSS